MGGGGLHDQCPRRAAYEAVRISGPYRLALDLPIPAPVDCLTARSIRCRARLNPRDAFVTRSSTMSAVHSHRTPSEIAAQILEEHDAPAQKLHRIHAVLAEPEPNRTEIESLLREFLKRIRGPLFDGRGRRLLLRSDESCSATYFGSGQAVCRAHTTTGRCQKTDSLCVGRQPVDVVVARSLASAATNSASG